MNELKIFVASSMVEVTRDKIEKIVEGANEHLKDNTTAKNSYKSIKFGRSFLGEGEGNTQQKLDDEAIKCDIFILLVRNGGRVGKFTFEEYNCALKQSQRAANLRPLIIAYVIKTESEEEKKKIKYITDDDVEHDDFEDKFGKDSGRYLEFCLEKEFHNRLLSFLKKNHFCAKYNQIELSYKNYIESVQQEYRKVSEKYYNRPEVDGRIEEIIKEKNSSLLILEGNTYSGKTRAAFELMKRNENWKNRTFYIYGRGSQLVDLNDNIKINKTNDGVGDVYFIDDINDIICECENLNPKVNLWAELGKVSGIPHWPKSTVIITISGNIERRKRNDIYKKMFGDDYRRKVNDITVDFDIYNRSDFKKLVNDLREDGVLCTGNFKPGNFTIGCLFIDEEVIKNNLTDLKGEYGEDFICVLHALKCHWMFEKKNKGDYISIRNLYNCIIKNRCDKRNKEAKSLEDILDGLRRKGLIALDRNDNEIINRIYIDSFVLEQISFFDSMEGAISDLIYYAKTYPDTIKPIKMGYVLIDRNEFDQEIICFLVKQIMLYKCAENKQIESANCCGNCSRCKDKDKKFNAFFDFIEQLYFHEISDADTKLFCASAVARWWTDFDDINDILNEYNSDESSSYKNDDFKQLYKDIIFALLHDDIRLSVKQKSELLNRIFDEKKRLIPPFEKNDYLESVHKLKRLVPYLSDSIADIMKMADETFKPSVDISESIIDDVDKRRRRKRSLNEKLVDEEMVISKEFLIWQLSKIVLILCKRTKNFADFEVIKSNLGASSSLENLNLATRSVWFARSFYNQIKDVVCDYSYEDKYNMFQFLVDVQDEKGVFGNGFVGEKEDIDQCYKIRVKTMNSLLEILDELDAIKAFNQMRGKEICDEFTLSMLMKNRFLGFEHLYYLVQVISDEKHDKDNVKKDGLCNKNLVHFITLNQLLDKAETISDARTCLRLMKVRDENPENLKDESGLGSYIDIKGVTAEEAIELIKKFKENNSRGGITSRDHLSHRTIGVLLSKFSFEQLKDFFGETAGGENYDEKWGLSLEEFQSAKRNATNYNYLFKKATKYKSEAKYIMGVFENLLKTKPEIVVDKDDNENTSILSVYLQNNYVFPTYEDKKSFFDDMYAIGKYPKLQKTHYVYGKILWKKIDESKQKDKSGTIREVNDLLIEAYNYFSERCEYVDVVKNMSNLYSYRIRLVSEDDFCNEGEYAYEDRMLKVTFIDYLDYLLQNESEIVDSKFVYNALLTMRSKMNENVYEAIRALAKNNRKGVRLEALASEDLHVQVLKRMFNVDDNIISIDSDMFYGYSSIKMLWWLLESNQIKYLSAKSYLEEHNIQITQTYLNMAFKNIKRDLNPKEAYEEMTNLIKVNIDNQNSLNTSLYKSIQMFFPMLDATTTVEQFNATLILFPKEYQENVGYLDLWMKKCISFMMAVKNATQTELLLKHLAEVITEKTSIVNISHINTYLDFMMQILIGFYPSGPELKNRVITVMKKKWEHLKNTGMIEVVNPLLDEKISVRELEADVRTYIYFPYFNRSLIKDINNKFNGDFYYQSKKKCLYDCLKNYSKCYPDIDTDTLDLVIRILEQPTYFSDMDSILKDYIFRQNGRVIDFWFRIFEGSNKMKIYAIRNFSKVFYPFPDSVSRIGRIQQVFVNPSEEIQELINRTRINVRKDNWLLFIRIFGK